MLLVSSCLAGKACRYDGTSCLQERIQQLSEDNLAIMVCPEQIGGLPTPREPAEIVGGTGEDVLNGKAEVITKSGANVTKQFISGASKTLEIAKEINPSVIILKENSPSCGSSFIYDGSFAGMKKSGDGVTAALLKKEGFTVISENHYLDAESLRG